MSETIDIHDLNKASVLQALYNAAKPQGTGFIQYDPKPMNAQEAIAILKSGQTYFDYLKGRVMKVDLKSDSFDPWGYDRDNGEGTAAAVIDQIRKTGDANTPAIAKTHSDHTFLSAIETESVLASESGIISDPSEETAVFQLGLGDLREHIEPKVKQAKEIHKDN